MIAVNYLVYVKTINLLTFPKEEKVILDKIFFLYFREKEWKNREQNKTKKVT